MDAIDTELRKLREQLQKQGEELQNERTRRELAEEQTRHTTFIEMLECGYKLSKSISVQ